MALDGELSEQYFQLKGIVKRTIAPNQHARIADRRAALLREAIHKVESQLLDDGAEVQFRR
eukprot:1308192-Amphidinium_carterae.1